MKCTGIISNLTEEKKHTSSCGKRARHPEDDCSRDLPPTEVSVEQNAMACKMRSIRNNILEDRVEGPHAVPDVAAAIEDLLAQSNKV